MAVERFTAQRFRCLENIEIEPGPDVTLVYGANASGKTSLLEALAYLGRGKSFLGAPLGNLIQHGQADFVLHGRTRRDGRSISIGVRNSREGLEVRVDGEPGGGAAALALTLPLQVVDPAVHGLVSGGPDERRRFLDWLTFHVEHGYGDVWRQFRRALKQRNVLLRAEAAGKELEPWTVEVGRLGEIVSEHRQRAFDRVRGRLEQRAGALLEAAVGFEYRRGWVGEGTLLDYLLAHEQRDREQGNTQHGPHRAELSLRVDDRVARRLVSRGQQKLLASAMILGATEAVQEELGQRLLLLLDDPAAELDQRSVGRLFQAALDTGAQIIATSLSRDALPLPDRTRVFHVEHGRIEPST